MIMRQVEEQIAEMIHNFCLNEGDDQLGDENDYGSTTERIGKQTGKIEVFRWKEGTGMIAGEARETVEG